MYLNLEDLRKHTAILGMTGSGKTTTKNRIVIDAWKNGISSLLIEPAKTDARTLMGAIPELRVFTVGLEQVTPLRLNPFFVEEGIRVQLHMDLLHSCFMSAWPMYGILANHLRRVLLLTYTSNGWDILKDSRGELVTPEDFLRQAEVYSRRLRYGDQLKQDFRGAILTRAEELCDPSRAAILNARHNLSTRDLLSVPTVVELCHIGDADFRAFLLSLLLIRVYEHFSRLGPAKNLRNLLVIDEAHSVLEELPKVVDTEMAAASRRKAVDQLIDLIAEARSPGLGTVIADQNPTRLARDALKTCCT
jgi:DNA helicase HerA-like ATPase